MIDSSLRAGANFAIENRNVMSNYLKIGEFSKLMQTTVKTLRLYEQRRLLLPDHIDEDSGYRYYRVSQMQRLNAIRSLKRLGFSLEEIRDLFLFSSCVTQIAFDPIFDQPEELSLLVIHAKHHLS